MAHRRSGTGKPARLSVDQSRAVLNRLARSRAQLPTDKAEAAELLRAIEKLTAVVHGELEAVAS